METLIIAIVLFFIGFYTIFKCISWICTGLSDWLFTRKQRKENAEITVKRKALDEEAKEHCGDNWVAQMQYKVKKSLFTLRELRAKDHPEEFYRDAKGVLQPVKQPEKEKKIELKTKEFKCPNCAAPLGSVNDKMQGLCEYCGAGVAFMRS